MREYKSVKKYIWIMLLVFMVGVFMGSIYAAGIKGADADEIYEYLCGFFENNTRSGGEVFLTSFLDNLKLFALIFTAGFFKIGTVFIMSAGCVEGFISGFTSASVIKSLGSRGLLLNLSSVFSVVIFVIGLLFFGAYSMEFGLSGKKREKNLKKKYIIISSIFLTIFCIASLFDGYITTIFMKFIVTGM